MSGYTVGVVGGGGVGLTCAAFLSGSANIVIKTRSQEQADELNKNGITMTSVANGENFRGFEASSNVDSLDECDVIVIAVKSYDTESAAIEISKSIKPDAEVVTLQNGLGALEILKANLENPDRVFQGVTFVGATRSEAGKVKLGMLTKTAIDSAAKVSSEVFSGSRYEFIASDDIGAIVWDKMALNVAQNALGAITGLDLLKMGASEHCLSIAGRLLDELEAVTGAEGITFDYVLLDKLKENWTGSPHHPSMWQDLQAGKRTEIDALNGIIVGLGEKHGIATPFNEALVGLILAVE